MTRRAFWQGRRVLLTGHTGFKGAWLAYWLGRLGAHCHGLALAPDTRPALFDLLFPHGFGAEDRVDLRDRVAVRRAVERAAPEIVIHMAAQSLVLPSYDQPVETFSTNVVGTLHLLDALRDGSIIVTLVVTSDKVYANDDAGVPFTELAPLGGDDPYSASKAATEIAVNSWRKSFPEAAGCLISARAGNVLGGGDFAEHRLIPDIMRAVLSGQPLMLRAPRAVRPWQHVLDVLGGYLTYIERAHDNSAVPPALNFGPSSNVRVSAGTLVDMMIDRLGLDVAVEIDSSHNAPEKHVLSLDASEAGRILGWVPRLNLQETVDWTAAWYRAWIEKSDIRSITDRQIADFEARSLS